MVHYHQDKIEWGCDSENPGYRTGANRATALSDILFKNQYHALAIFD